MTDNAIIRTNHVSFSFTKGIKTLSDINLEVEKGSIYGFLGPNGAGKTTTLRLLLGLLKDQEGSINIFGVDHKVNRIANLRRIGSLIEQPSLYAHLTARENLEVYRKIYGASKNRVDEVLKLVDLAHTGNKKAKQFSLGMKQRLSIALALLHQSELLILDEPTDGLDPNGIIEIRELIRTLNRDHGVTILVSSHILAEVEKMATHVGIIHKGKLLFQGTLAALQQMKKQQTLMELDTSDNAAAASLLQDHGVQKQNGHLVMPFKSRQEVGLISRQLVSNNIDIYLIHPQQSDLEQLFLEITSDQ